MARLNGNLRNGKNGFQKMSEKVMRMKRFLVG